MSEEYRGRRPKFQPNERWEAHLKEIVPDAELLRENPFLSAIKVGYINDGTSHAAWFPRTQRILIHAQNEEKFREYLQHETEHAIQDHNGGPPGDHVRYQGVKGTPDHKRAIKRYMKLPGEKMARQAQSLSFEEYFRIRKKI